MFLSIHRGDDRELTITATDPLDSSDVFFTAKRSHRDDDEDAVIRKSTGGNGVTVSGSVATVQIDREDTQDLDPVALYWDVQVIGSDGDYKTVADGRLAIRADITRGAGS